MKIIHQLPGRVRIEMAELMGHRRFARLISHNLVRANGILEVVANFTSGRLLIKYDNNQLDINQLKKLIRLNVIILTNKVYKQAAEIAVTEEVNLFSKQGLSPAVARQRLIYYGPNQLPSPPKPTIADIFLRTLTENYMSKVLLGLGGFSLVMGKTANAFMSISVLAVNTVMAAAQERRTQNSLQQLNDLVPSKAWVMRGGKLQTLEAKDLVPGDIVFLEAGDKVPADARLLKASQLVVEEASLTGESAPVVKDITKPDRSEAVYMGTGILSGKAQAVIIATGADTEMGRISQTINAAPSPSPFYQRLDEVFHTLVNGGVAISGVSVLAGLWHRQNFGNILESSTSLAVSFIPDALAPIVTLTTALGAMRLSKKQVALRQFSAIDTLGCATIICCDKTGTLTRNQMEVQEVYGLNMRWCLTEGQFIEVDERRTEKLAHLDKQNLLLQIFRIAALCNNAILKNVKNSEYTVEGDSTEGALLIGGQRAGFALENAEFSRLEEIPFSSETMYMAVIGRDQSGNLWSFVKGAPDIILEKCTKVDRGNKVTEMMSEDKAKFNAEVRRMSGKALRVLAMAYKPYRAGDSPEQGLIMAGLTGIIDPPRHEAKEFVKSCQEAGVKIVMITGDHRETALAIARQLGIATDDNEVLTGPELKQSAGDLAKTLGKVRVYARTSPEQKQALVRVLKEHGQIVAMVGDGVNDVPAIKEAHLGVAMAASGTAVARETSGVALTNDNINGLLEAIKEGRNVYANIRQAIRYMITTNFGDGVVILVTSLLGNPIPLTPIQLLWVNATSDPYISWSLANFPPTSEIMQKPPRKPDVNIFGQGLGGQIISRSLLIGLSAFIVYRKSLKQDNNINLTRTKTMAVLSLGRLLHVIDFRKKPSNAGIDKSNPNQRLKKGALIMFSGLLAATYVPGLNSALKTEPLGIDDWLQVLGASSIAYLSDIGMNRIFMSKKGVS